MKLEEFKELWEKEAKTPEGATKCFIIAMIEWTVKENKEGKQMLELCLPGPKSPKRPQPARIQIIKTQFGGTQNGEYMYQSSLGGTPEKKYENYSYDNDLDLIKVEGDDKWTEVTFRSGGKDLPVGTGLMKNKDGHWKMFEYSCLITGVKDPVDDGDW